MLLHFLHVVIIILLLLLLVLLLSLILWEIKSLFLQQVSYWIYCIGINIHIYIFMMFVCMYVCILVGIQAQRCLSIEHNVCVWVCIHFRLLEIIVSFVILLNTHRMNLLRAMSNGHYNKDFMADKKIKGLWFFCFCSILFFTKQPTISIPLIFNT